MSALLLRATARADIRWWISEASACSASRRAFCARLKRLLVVVLDQSRTGNAQFARPPHSLRNKFLIGHAVESASRANFAVIDDVARPASFRPDRRHHRAGIAFFDCELPGFLEQRFSRHLSFTRGCFGIAHRAVAPRRRPEGGCAAV